MDYIAYLETAWAYFPYIFYTFVFLTFLPKSLGKIKAFADADYDANRNKYHRCYAPDVCCHTHLGDGTPTTKPKQRKAVTRVYPKKQSIAAAPAAPHELKANVVKRQVQASAIQTQTNVNQIAKMFETGGATSKKINRVTPTVVPEIRTHTEDVELSTKRTAQFSQLLQENIENSVNLLNQAASAADAEGYNWRSEPLAPLQRRSRNVPNTLSFAGTSATPSTASPAASSPLSSPVSSSPMESPVLRSAPLNLTSSLEDIFIAIARNAEKNESFIYAGCNALSPVTSIEDILSQRRLSRPLSAYSISDLLNSEENAGMDEAYVESFLRTLNKT